MSRGEDIYDVEDSDAPRGGVAGPRATSAANQKSKFTCPYCDQSIDADSPVCPMCGSNLRKARKPALAPIAAPVTTGDRPIRVSRAKPQTQPTQSPSRRAKLISAIVVSVSVVAISIWAIRFSVNRASPAGVSSGSKSSLPQDQAVEKQIEEESGAEARKWLESDLHEVQGLSRKQALFKVDEIYGLGAARVVAFGGGISRTLAIELPDDKSKRKQVLDWANKWNLDKGFQKEPDVGQKWIVIGTRM